MGPVLVMMIMAIPLLAILSKSEIGHAIADAIRHNSGAGNAGSDPAELADLRAEVEHLRLTVEDLHLQVLENAERVDFAERLLAGAQQNPTQGGEGE